MSDSRRALTTSEGRRVHAVVAALGVRYYFDAHTAQQRGESDVNS